MNSIATTPAAPEEIAATDNTATQAKDPISQQKYMIALVEMMRRKNTLAYISEHYEKSEAVVKDNIRRYYGGLNDDMRAIKLKLESASNMLKMAQDKPNHAEFGCSMAKDQLDEVIAALEGFANPI